jgi:hypothetical protein
VPAGSIYHAEYELRGIEGVAQMQVEGTDAAGNHGFGRRTVAYTLVVAGKPAIIASPCGTVLLDIPRAAIDKDGYLCIWPVDTEEPAKCAEGFEELSKRALDVVPVGEAYTFSLGRAQLQKEIIVSWRYGPGDLLKSDGARLEEEWKIGLYRLENHEWVYVGGRADGNAHRVTLAIDRLGTYRLQYDERRPPVPTQFGLCQNYPNPFNPWTAIQYHVPCLGARPSVHLTLRVYSILGQEILTLVDREVRPGCYQTYWDGKDARGDDVASGVYFCRLVVEGRVHIIRMVLVR